MRIVFMSDAHLSPSTDFYVENVLMREDYDVVLSCGDWDYVPKYLSDYEVYSIYGNHDDVEELSRRTRLLNDLRNPVGANVVQIGDLVVCALGGAIIRDNLSYPETWHTPDDYLRGYFVLREKLRSEFGKCDVLLTHDAPLSLVKTEFEVLPESKKAYVDSKSYRDVFDVIAKLLSPRFYLCGHVHSSSVTFGVIRNFDVYSNTHDVPVLKNVFVNDKLYTVLDTEAEKVEVKNWAGQLVRVIDVKKEKFVVV